MSSVKTINRAVLLIWLSYVCQAFIIVYFSKFQKAQKYENQISVAGFRELFMCLFFVNSCVTKNIIQLKFYLIIKLLTLLLLLPRFITVITQTTIYIILGLLLLLFFDISLYFFYYKTLSIMYKKYYFTRFGASEDLKAIFWVYIALTMEENILFIASRYPLPLHLEAIISPLVASIFYINSMQKEYPIRRYFAIFALEVQFLVNILLFIVYAPAFRGEM